MNINSIRNKCELLKDQIKGNIDTLVISETKIDDNFRHSQFLIEGFSKPYILDRNSNGGETLLNVRGDMPSNLLAIENKPIESFSVELNLRNDKCSYTRHKSLIGNHFDANKLN